MFSFRGQQVLSFRLATLSLSLSLQYDNNEFLFPGIRPLRKGKTCAIHRRPENPPSTATSHTSHAPSNTQFNNHSPPHPCKLILFLIVQLSCAYTKFLLCCIIHQFLQRAHLPVQIKANNYKGKQPLPRLAAPSSRISRATAAV